MIRVTRTIEVYACGEIINPKAAHDQEIGGIVWGIDMALQEVTVIDHRYGRIMNPNLQHYHVAAGADIHQIHTAITYSVAVDAATSSDVRLSAGDRKTISASNEAARFRTFHAHV